MTTIYLGHCFTCGEPATFDVQARTANPRTGRDSYRARQACDRHVEPTRKWCAGAGTPTVRRIAAPAQPSLFEEAG